MYFLRKHADKFKEDYIKHVDTLCEKIPMLRMTPMNKYRKSCISNFEEMYPWYSFYHKLPYTFLNDLVQNWYLICKGDFSQIQTNVDESIYEDYHYYNVYQIKWIIINLLNDEKLVKMIDTKYKQINNDDTFNLSYALRMWRMCYEYGFPEIHLSINIYNKGKNRILLHILDDETDSDDLIGKILSVTLCGRDLSDEVSFNILFDNFTWVLTNMKSERYTKKSIFTSILNNLQMWISNEIQSKDFILSINQIMNQYLLDLSYELPYSNTDESSEKLINKLNLLKSQYQVLSET